MTFAEFHAEAVEQLAAVRAAGTTEAMEKTMALLVKLAQMLADASIVPEAPAVADATPLAASEIQKAPAKRERKVRKAR